MNFPDVNLLLGLFRPEHAFHAAARQWWRETVDHGDTFTVPDVVWTGFVRVVTDPRAFAVPASLSEAMAFVAAVRSQPSYRAFVSHSRTLQEFVDLASRAHARGNLVSDAYIAACAQAYGGTVVTFDRDFRKFDDLRVRELSA